MFNPEGDAGDIEMWELICPMIYLSRRIKPNTGGPGRHRGGSSFESLHMIWNTPFWELQNLGTSRLFTSQGIFGGYPGSVAYIHNIRDNNLAELAAAGDAYPVADGPFSELALRAIDGERELKLDNFTLLEPFKAGDLYHSVMKGAAGIGDPLERPADAVQRDVDDGHIEAEFAESVYAVSDRDAARARRLERARPVADWWATERERVLAGDLIEPVKVGYEESIKLSPRWAAEFRGFWDLPQDFCFGVDTPTLAPDLAAQPGKVTPEDSAREFLESSEVATVEPPVAVGRTLERETLEAMLDERLSRREVKEIQSGYKDPDRFDKWVAILQDRVDWDDRIVLPLGEALYVVRRRPDGELVIRSEAGHDFCRFDENWKMHAVLFVRDSDELLGEVYPRMAHCDSEWMELREFYCPRSGRLLEVEAVTPGYPVVHDFLPDVDGFYRGWLGRELP
jgi:acetone carboxylase gamma subunit